MLRPAPKPGRRGQDAVPRAVAEKIHELKPAALARVQELKPVAIARARDKAAEVTAGPCGQCEGQIRRRSSRSRAARASAAADAAEGAGESLARAKLGEAKGRRGKRRRRPRRPRARARRRARNLGAAGGARCRTRRHRGRRRLRRPRRTPPARRRPSRRRQPRGAAARSPGPRPGGRGLQRGAQAPKRVAGGSAVDRRTDTPDAEREHPRIPADAGARPAGGPSGGARGSLSTRPRRDRPAARGRPRAGRSRLAPPGSRPPLHEPADFRVHPEYERLLPARVRAATALGPGVVLPLSPAPLPHP